MANSKIKMTKIKSAMRMSSITPMLERTPALQVVSSSQVESNASASGSVNHLVGINSPNAIVRKVLMTMIAFGGICTAHSVKKTTNCSMFIIPQRSLSEAPRTMLIKMLLVAIVFAVLCALSIVDVIAAACPGSICLGSLTTKGFPSLTETSESGSEKTEELKVMLIVAGALGSYETASGFECVNFISTAILVASITSISTRSD